MKHKPLLITGTHRSGSTWVGEVLSFSPEVRLITEPFSPINTWCGFDVFVKYWFHHLTEEELSIHQKRISHVLGFQYDVKDLQTNIRNIHFFRGKLGAVRNYVVHNVYNRKKTVIKDPLALLSAERLYKRFPLELLVLIRHPAAFVSSIIRMNKNFKDWGVDFLPQFLQQTEIINGPLKEYKKSIENALQHEDLMGKSILMWNLLHCVIFKYKEKYGDKWLFYRHEDLSDAPIDNFRQIFDRVGLTFTDNIKSALIKSTGAENPVDAVNNDLHVLRRNSKANIFSWRKRLSEQDIDRIYEGTFKLWQHFYAEEDWGTGSFSAKNTEISVS